MTLGRPSVLIPIAPGTNRNQELADAFELAGAKPTQIPLSALREGETKVVDHQILAIPGGFSYGDALGAGRLFGLDLMTWFGDQIRSAVDRQMPVIGICNGFQALVAAGILPGNNGAAALVGNDSHQFECRWVSLKPQATNSAWLDAMTAPLRCPVAHAEGKLVVDDQSTLDGQVAFNYVGHDGSSADGVYPVNPNGSVDDVAGIVDPSGLVLGLMPHPEDHVMARQDPLKGRRAGGSCLPLFSNGVAAA